MSDAELLMLNPSVKEVTPNTHHIPSLFLSQYQRRQGVQKSLRTVQPKSRIQHSYLGSWASWQTMASIAARPMVEVNSANSMVGRGMSEDDELVSPMRAEPPDCETQLKLM